MIRTIYVYFLALLIAGQLLAQTTTTTTTIPASEAAPGTTTTTSEQPPNGVELEVGLVSRIGGPAISNYQSNNAILTLTNLGRATPQLLTGLGFSFCERGRTTTTTTFTPARTTQMITRNGAEINGFCRNRMASKLGVFVAAQFGSGSNQTVTGYSVGITYGLGKYLRFLAGFSETPVSEVSPGFRNAAAQYVAKTPALFPGINPASLAANAYGAFDGIQTTITAPPAGATPTAMIYYPGAVTETHYRGGFLIGVSLPINIFNLLGGNSTSNQ
jgi:hypothetical protein